MSCSWSRHFLQCTSFGDYYRQMNPRSRRSLGRVCPRSVWRSTGTRHESWHGYSTAKTWKSVVSRGSELFTWLLALATKTKHTTRTNKRATFDSAIVCLWFKSKRRSYAIFYTEITVLVCHLQNDWRFMVNLSLILTCLGFYTKGLSSGIHLVVAKDGFSWLICKHCIN